MRATNPNAKIQACFEKRENAEARADALRVSKLYKTVRVYERGINAGGAHLYVYAIVTTPKETAA